MNEIRVGMHIVLQVGRRRFMQSPCLVVVVTLIIINILNADTYTIAVKDPLGRRLSGIL